MKRNAYFQLIHQTGNMFLKGFPAVENGEPLMAEDVVAYLDAKKIANIDVHTIQEFVKNINREQKEGAVLLIKEDIIPENEFLQITIDPNGMFAKGRFYPPTSLGKQLTKEDILSLIAQAGIKYGIVMKNIDIFCKARLYCTDIVLAKAKKPVHGSDAVIHYNFDVSKTRKPTLNEDGTVDFHQLDMIPKIEQGQVLATLTPADKGVAGTDVYGNRLMPKKVKEKKLRHGMNIHLSDDGLTMYADVSGHASVADEQVFVSDTYEVPADVSAATGDINYNGNVEVKGNVMTGYKIEAAGDIVVNGVVEGATLIAGGQIIIKRGVQGMAKGCLKAQGEIVSKFLENCDVRSESSITTDAIMHSHVESGQKIVVSGKRGLITGGAIRASKSIEAKTVGSTMGTATELEVGVDPGLLGRYHEIEGELKSLEENHTKMQQIVTLLEKKLEGGEELSEDKLKLLQMSKDSVRAVASQIEDLTEEYDEIAESLNEQKSGKIVVTGITYPGVKLTIANVATFIRAETHHSTFVRDGADIRTRGI